jgi:putative PEP-CTERM system TPR-repeat lipoprotein
MVEGSARHEVGPDDPRPPQAASRRYVIDRRHASFGAWLQMRRTVTAALIALVVVGTVGGGWLAYARLLRDPLAVARDLMSRGDPRAAELELRNAVRRNPGSAEAHFRLGEVQLQLGDAVAADRELKAARAAGFPDAQVVPVLARTYLAEERFVDLLRELPPAGLPPDGLASLLVSRSLAQIATQDGSAAIASATAAERLAPRMAEAPLAGGRIALAMGDHSQALQKADEALLLNPGLIEALGLKADILRADGDFDQAIAQLDLAVTATPTAARVRLARARVLMAEGENSRARADVAAALKAEPRSTLGIYLLAVLQVRDKDWPGADVTLQKVQPVLARLPRGEYYYGLVKAKLGQLEQAAEAAGHYVAHSPDDPDGYRLVADVDLAMRPPAATAAQAALRKVAELGGNTRVLPVGAAMQLKSDVTGAETAESLTHLAALQLDAGDAGGAGRDLDLSLEVAPVRPETGVVQVTSALAAGDIPRAQASLDRLARMPDADPAVVGNLTGLVRMATLDVDGARTALQAAAQEAPDAVPVRINLARVLALQGQLAEAEKLLTGVLDAQPANRPALRELVELDLAQGRVKDAIASVLAARKAAPGLLGLLVTEAALRARDGDFPGAYATLDDVPLEQSRSAVLLTTRAQIQLSQGRSRDAVDSYRQILLNDAGDSRTRLRLIQLLMGMSQSADSAARPALLAEALKLAQDGLARQPGNSGMLQTVALLVWRTAGLEAALAMADTALRDPINLPAARLLKGGLYMADKRYADAAAAYAAELKEAPFSALVVAESGALRAAGRGDEAMALLRGWVAKAPDPTVAQTLAMLDIDARRLDDAQTHLENVLAMRPGDAVALNNLAWVYQQKGNPKARGLAEKAYLLAPSPQTADTLGWILAQQGDTRTGLLLLRRAAQILKNDATVQYHLAVSLQANGLRDEAATVLTAALARPGEFDDRAAATKLQQQLLMK